MKNIINLTPHAINIVGNQTITIPASGQVARVSMTTTSAGTHEGIPLVRGSYGEVVGLPDAQPGVLYVVSALVRAAIPHRTDLASPAKLVRNEAGQIMGCEALEIN